MNGMKRIIANTFGVVAVAALVLFTNSAVAATPAANDITAQFITAGVNVDALRAVEVGGIVVLRGRVADPADGQRAAAVALSLGYKRVANLIQVVEPADDVTIERIAERRLGIQRSLDGCQFHIDSDNGVLHLSGKVQYELQKDMAMQIVRNIDGVRSVRNELQK